MVISISLTIICIICLYVFIKIKYNHWNNKRVRGPLPLPFVGNFGQLIMQKQSISQLVKAAYQQFPEEKVVGLYCGFTPTLLIRDPEIIRHVLITDFNKFVNRGVKTAEGGFSDNIIVSENDTWRIIRKKMTPAFTGTKLKQMAPLILKIINKFTNQVELSKDYEGNCDMKELAARYAMELITSCGFGLDLNFYSDELRELIRIGKETVNPNLLFRLWYAAEVVMPGIQSFIPVVDPTAHTRTFFTKVINQVINERKKSSDTRHDIMEVLINLLEEDKNKRVDSEGNPDLIVDANFIASQVFVLFVTGYETSSSTLSCLLYELALHEDIQDTTYKEICAVLEKHNGNLTYDSVNDMAYLRKVLYETMRRNTLVGWIIRKASEDYILPETNTKVNAGSFILIPPNGLHSDPKYYQNPDVFNPERFSADNLSKIPQCAFMPFGMGPRNCIGYRFAMLHLMMAAAAFLRKFKVSPCTDNNRKVQYDTISITLTPVDGIWVNVSKRQGQT